MTRIRIRSAASITAAIALALSSGAALALDKVKVGKSGPDIVWTALDAGTEAKIWDSVGLEVEPIQFAGDAKTQQALAAGEIEFGLGSGPAMGFRVKGVPAIAIAAIAGPPYSFVIVVPPKSPIRSADGLKGKIIGVTTAGSLTDWLVRRLSRQQGWGPMGIQSVPLGNDLSRLAAMKKGELEGFVVPAVTAYGYEEKHEAKILLSFGSIVKNFHTNVLFAPDRLIASNPGLIRRFLKGWFESVAYMKAHKDIGVKIAAKSLNNSESAVAKAYDQEMKMLSDNGTFSPAAIDVIRRSLVELHILDKVPDAKSLYTEEFVPVKH